MKTSIAVIGGGAAGAVAALKARQLGAEVILIRESWGATALGTGLWDLIGVAPYDRMTHFKTLDEALNQVCRRYPLHPYAILGNGDAEAAANSISEGVNFLLGQVQANGLEYSGQSGTNVSFMNSMGLEKVSCLAPKSMEAGMLESLKGKKAALMGINGFGEFRQDFLARSLKEIIGSDAGEIASFSISLPKLEDRADLIAVELGRYFDDEKRREAAVGAMKQALGALNPDVVGLPAVLGLDKPSEAFKSVESGLGRKVFEVIPQGPSVPGFRLQRALEAALAAAGIPVVPGQVVDFEARDGEIKVLEVMVSERRMEIETGVVALATGKYIGRGIVRDNCFIESIFDLPVFSGGQAVRDVPVQRLISEKVFDRHPVFSVGVKVNNDFKPIDDLGEVLYENLFAAGSALANYDYIVENSGMGVAIATGYRAGINAAAQAGAEASA